MFGNFGLRSFFIRWFAALILVLATFNPHFSYFQWAISPDNIPLKVLVGVLLLIAYVVFFRATFRSIGVPGLVLMLVLFGAIGWVLVDFGILTPESSSVIVIYLGLIALATLLAVGLSWSHIRRRLTGQVDSSEVGDTEN